MRDKLEIIRDIVRVCQRGEGVIKTRIMQSCNMSPLQMGIYLPLLLANSFIEQREDGKYYATAKGIEFAENLDRACLMVNYNERN